MSESNKIEFTLSDAQMKPAHLEPKWILEGTPLTRNVLVSSSRDGLASTWFWDCTAGRFDWYYEKMDETACILEGSVIVRDDFGIECRLNIGDTAFFPAGSHAVWVIDSYVRKVAFLRCPLPFPFPLLRSMKRTLRWCVRYARAAKQK